MSLNHSPSIVTDGLVLCLDAANQRSYPKSGTTWSDLAGANDGTLTNGPTFDSNNGGSLVFDGTNDYINASLPSEIDTSQDLSINIWFYYNISTSSDNQYRYLFQIRDSTSSKYIYLGKWRSGLSDGLYVDYQNSGIRRFVLTTSSDVPDPNLANGTPDFYYDVVSKWTNATITIGSNVMTLYINSLHLGSVSILSGDRWNDASSSLRIASTNSNTLYHKGNIANFSMYNRALTAKEIRQNYEATVGRYT